MSQGNIYVIDTCSLIELNRHNPIDLYPTVWKSVEILIDNGLIVAPKEVLKEINRQDDKLTIWAKKQKKLFKPVTKRQTELVQEILKDNPSLLQVDRESDADAWVIALAVEMANSPQATLFPIKRIIVTEEKLRGTRVRIPFVCQKYKIECIAVLEMFRIEKLTF